MHTMLSSSVKNAAPRKRKGVTLFSGSPLTRFYCAKVRVESVNNVVHPARFLTATPSRPGFRPAHLLAKLSAILPDVPNGSAFPPLLLRGRRFIARRR